MIIKAISPAEAYRLVLTGILDTGKVREPRGLKTLDGGFTVVEIIQPFDRPLPLGVRPNLSTKVAAVEAIQLIGGFAAPGLMVAASPKFAEFREPDGQFWGAYGARIGHQISNVVDKLQRDEDTRQAVVTLWDPLRDNQPGKKDYPCTIAIQFEVHGFHLNMTVTMRSNDAWLGLPYDMFQFSQLQQTVANVLNKTPGLYRHVAWSMHLYQHNWEGAEEVVFTSTKVNESHDFQPAGIGSGFTSYGDVRKLARSLAYQGLPTTGMRQDEAWYGARLNELRGAGS